MQKFDIDQPSRLPPEISLVKGCFKSDDALSILGFVCFGIKQTVGLAVAMGSSLCELSELCGSKVFCFLFFKKQPLSFFILFLKLAPPTFSYPFYKF